MPNYFAFNGPNAPVGAGSLVPATEAQGDYMLKAVNKLQSQNIKSMVPKDECVEEFVEHVGTFPSVFSRRFLFFANYPSTHYSRPIRTCLELCGPPVVVLGTRMARLRVE